MKRKYKIPKQNTIGQVLNVKFHWHTNVGTQILAKTQLTVKIPTHPHTQPKHVLWLFSCVIFCGETFHSPIVQNNIFIVLVLSLMSVYYPHYLCLVVYFCQSETGGRRSRRAPQRHLVNLWAKPFCWELRIVAEFVEAAQAVPLPHSFNFYVFSKSSGLTSLQLEPITSHQAPAITAA